MTWPTLNRQQAREVDRRAIEEFGMSSLVLMENAGRGVTDTIMALGVRGPVLVCCGKGNNGGDGLVIARHLEIRGASPRVLLFADPQSLSTDARTNFQILEKTDVPIDVCLEGHDHSVRLPGRPQADWLIDALLGTGTHGEPRPPCDAIIDWMNAQPSRKLAVDLPSGLDADTGQPARCTFAADHTCTFVAAKPGLFAADAASFVGQLHVMDIGAPLKLVNAVIGASSTG